MKLQPLGKTGLMVSPIGIGTAALGRPGYINLGHGEDLQFDYTESHMEEQTHQVLTEAYKLGIRYMDTARSYGKGEYFLGTWLNKNTELDNIVVGSKWGYTYTAGWKVQADKHEVKEHSINVLQKQQKESLSNLGKQLHLYQIHSATFESGVLENQDVIEELWEIKSKGIRIGLSLSGANQAKVLEVASQIQRDGKMLFDVVQVTWNILETAAGEQLQKASKMGMGVIVKEALANGRLTLSNKEENFQSKLNKLQQLATKHSSTVDAIAIAYVLHQSWVSTVLSGAASIKHLQSNVKAIDISFDKEDLDLLQAMNETSETYWKNRGALAWN